MATPSLLMGTNTAGLMYSSTAAIGLANLNRQSALCNILAYKGSSPSNMFPNCILKMHGETFHSAMQPMLLLFQLIGVFPQYGILRKDPRELHFRWLTLRTLFSAVIILIGLTMSYIEYERLDRVGGVNAQNIIGIFFYVDTVISTALLVNLARRWQKLAVQFDVIHYVFFATGNDEKTKKGIHTTIRLTAVVLLSCGILQHVSAKTADVYNQYREAKFCGWDVHNFPHYFASRNYSFIFKHIQYNILILLFFEFSHVALTMSWGCHDLMIIVTSVCITYYFQQIYEKVQPFSSGITIANEKFWVEVRSQYVLLCEFVKEANGYLALIIIHSCGKNLYLLCFELINISRKEKSIASSVHHWCALIYLIVQTTLVFYCAAMINETARAPLAVCNRIPNIGWCSELDRFTGQLRTDRVAFTGMGFFRLTKRTMLAMAGTVITYELVMLKFAEDTEGIGDVVPCSRLAFSKD